MTIVMSQRVVDALARGDREMAAALHVLDCSILRNEPEVVRNIDIAGRAS